MDRSLFPSSVGFVAESCLSRKNPIYREKSDGLISSFLEGKVRALSMQNP